MPLTRNTWVKAAKSGGNNTGPNCVECLQWSPGDDATGTSVRIAYADQRGLHAHCAKDQCTYPDLQDGTILIRDTKLGQQSPLLVFTPRQFQDLVEATAAGTRHLDAGGRLLIRDPGNASLYLSFTPGEWDAFADGCRRGEFTLTPV